MYEHRKACKCFDMQGPAKMSLSCHRAPHNFWRQVWHVFRGAKQLGAIYDPNAI